RRLVSSLQRSRNKSARLGPVGQLGGPGNASGSLATFDDGSTAGPTWIVSAFPSLILYLQTLLSPERTSMRATSFPPLANIPPRTPPIAPAPMTDSFDSLLGIFPSPEQGLIRLSLQPQMLTVVLYAARYPPGTWGRPGCSVRQR